MTPLTVRVVINMFKDECAEHVMRLDFNHPESDLEKHRGLICEDFRQCPLAPSKEAADWI